MFTRPTALAAAFVSAAAKAELKNQDLSKPKVDHWVPRRVAMRANQHGFGMVTEFDRSPTKPKKTLNAATIKGINAAIDELVEIGAAQKLAPVAGLEDTEVVGID